jgi:hypothetical protein
MSVAEMWVGVPSRGAARHDGDVPRVRRRRLERIQGIAFDAILIAIAAAAGEQVVQSWLFEHPRALFHGLTALHLITCPALLVATVAGHGKAAAELTSTRSGGLFGWTMALLWGGSFIIPGVLALIFRVAAWEMMTAIFGPLVVFALWMWAIIVAERRGWVKPARLGEPKPWWSVQALAVLSWAYLIWLETMLISAAAKPGPLSQVGVPLGVAIDYLPVRIAMYYVRDSARWEVWTIVATVGFVLYQVATA